MDLQDLMIFARVAAVQNLSAVGVELGFTPGTISKRLQSLEDALAVRLFERTTRSIRITDEGTRLLPHVTRILAEYEAARASIETASGKLGGKIRLCAPHLLSRRLIGRAMLQFQDTYPEIEMQLDATDRTVNMLEDAYDIAIRLGDLSDSSMIAKRLCVDRVIIAGAPSYFERCGTPHTPQDLAAHQCLVAGDGASWTFGSSGNETHVRVNGRFHSDSGDLLRHAALQGKGLLRSTHLQLQEELASGKLVSVLSSYIDSAMMGVYALYVSGRHVPLRHRVFLDFLSNWFRKETAKVLELRS